jgi:DNA end-binding protein Ku
MPRAIWSGSISFGLVNIPVKLYSAISEKSVRFNQIDRRNGARVRQQRINAETGEEVPYEEIVKGYEISKGSYVILSDDDLASFAPEATHTLDLECFVDLEAIDPIFFDGAYHVAPSGAAKPYALLVQAMEDAGKVAIARFVMRSKQHVAVLRPRDGTLLLSMMVYADEVNPPATIGEFEALDGVTVDPKELAMAESLIESLSEEWEPEDYHDTYREQVLDLIDKLADGQVVAADTTPPPSADKVIDLMAALEASVREAKASRSRHPTALDLPEGEVQDEAADDVEEETAAGETPSRRSPARRAPAKSTSKRATAKSGTTPKSAKSSGEAGSGRAASKRTAKKAPATRKSA